MFFDYICNYLYNYMIYAIENIVSCAMGRGMGFPRFPITAFGEYLTFVFIDVAGVKLRSIGTKPVTLQYHFLWLNHIELVISPKHLL